MTKLTPVEGRTDEYVEADGVIYVGRPGQTCRSILKEVREAEAMEPITSARTTTIVDIDDVKWPGQPTIAE